jgi:phosphatidylethanolamine-binding protein (PEBP) family uncharacterized protein
MKIQRSLAPFVFVVAPVFLARCSTETPADSQGGAGSSSAGAGNGASGASGAGGSTAGSTSSGGTAGNATGGSGVAGSSAGGGSSGAGVGGVAGSSGAAGASSGGGGAGGAGSGGSGAGGSAGGAASGGGGSGAGGAASGAGGGGAFVLTSSKIVTDMEMSADFTCAGDAHSPPLAWTGAPAGTMSFAMVFVDTTIINANMMDTRGYHSAIWDIPASTMALPENLPVGAMLTTPVMARQFNPLRAAYLGPCPNNGALPADTYEFRLFALPVATLTGLPAQLNVRGILQAITAANPLGTAVLRVRSDATGTLK